MLIVPTQALPNQTLQISLAQQSLQLAIYQTNYGLFTDVVLAGTTIAVGVLSQNLNPIVRAAYTGFIGELVWLDNSGAGEDPVYTGLGDQFQLIYLEAADL
jgi:hypothetical protein